MVRALLDTNSLHCDDDTTTSQSQGSLSNNTVDDVASQSHDSMSANTNTGDNGEELCNGLTTNQNTANTSNNMMHHDAAFRLTVVCDIGSLKATVNNLKWEVQELRSKMSTGPTGTYECNSCLMHLRLKNPTSEKLDKALLESKLSTSILGFDITRASPTPAFRVMILKSCLNNAITHARANGCIADIWSGKVLQSPPRHTGMSETLPPTVSVLSP